MNLTPFSDNPFDDDDAFKDFGLAHGLAHDKIAAVMYDAGFFYEAYPLYDARANDRDWLLTHQQEHQSIFAQLGLNGLPDLATVDLRNEDEWEDWNDQHAQIHERINAFLGIV